MTPTSCSCTSWNGGCRVIERRSGFPGGRRGWVLAALVAIGVVAWLQLGLAPARLVPRAGGLQIARDFFAGALTPALDYQSNDVPVGAPPFLLRLLSALGSTVVYAAAAVALALPAGLLLGFVASSIWWAADPMRGGSRRRVGRSALAGTTQAAVRTLIAVLRSVHELLWAVVFLAAMGLSPVTGVLALAIPYSGTFAKVFSEMLDEAPTDSARAVRGVGAGSVGVFLWGILPRALPDMAAYVFYRFECAIRASAVLGFFGFPTIGYFLRASFEDTQYREVWSYLYALLALVLLLELWSSALRRRFVA
ncbi:MAG: phosphonate transport system permease protein [Chlamydiales bacterium]|jgi:phosphonate transport system permease protein